jgi:hypothetical protein
MSVLLLCAGPRLNLAAFTNSQAGRTRCRFSRFYVGVISLLQEIKGEL